MPVIDTLVLVRGVHFAATVVATGTVGFIVLVMEPALRGIGGVALLRRLTILVWAALAVAIVTGLAWLALVAASILDAPLTEVLSQGAVSTVLVDTRFGEIAGLRLGLAVTLGLLMVTPGFPGRRVLLLAAAAALAGLLAFVGHAGATPGAAGWLHLTSDLVHLLAAAAWLGGLPAFAMMLSWSRGRADPAGGALAIAATARFSVLGIVCVGALLASGLINSWELLNGPSDLLATAYGRVLSLKIGLFAVLVAIAAVNRYRLSPRLPGAAAMRALQRNTLVETGAGLAVLMLVGLLGTMIPGGHVHTNAALASSEAAFVHIHTEAVMADVTIDPGHAGNSTATIRLSRDDSSVYFARSVQITLAPREFVAPPVERAAAQMPDGTWRIENLEIPRAGVWTLRLDVDIGTGAPVVLDAPIVITQCSNECW
ncbi:MAG: copper homeostasis membrane protein CopD [Pseudolabrys sp.]|nr:copper homeostasis membrane protein CopD [Pseudolabrys sp.]